MNIPINDLGRHNNRFLSELKKVTSKVLDSGWYTLGREVKSFESEFADYCGVKFAIGVANGTDALELALKASGVGAGEEVITVANAGYYATTAILAMNAIPVFADVNPVTMLLDHNSAKSVISERTTAIIVTHLYGRVANMPAIMFLAQEFGLRVIEDCAQAHGAQLNGEMAGAWGDCAAFSFYPSKNLGALGDGGAIVTNSQQIYEQANRLRQYGWGDKYRVESGGGRNSRLDELQAAVLRVKLRYLDEMNIQRRERAQILTSQIENPLVITPVIDKEDYVAHLYVVRVKGRDELMNHLKIESIGSDIHYPLLDTQQKPLISLANPEKLPESIKLAGEILTLPCFPELESKELIRICEAVNGWTL